MRALVSDDIPNLDASKITSGTFDSARIPSVTVDLSHSTGTLPVSNGGTGATSFTNKALIIYDSTNSKLISLGTGTSG